MYYRNHDTLYIVESEGCGYGCGFTHAHYQNLTHPNNWGSDQLYTDEELESKGYYSITREEAEVLMQDLGFEF